MTAQRRRIVIISMLVSATLAAILLRPLTDAGGFLTPSKSEAAGARRMFTSALTGLDAAAIAAVSQEYGLEARMVSESDWRGLRLTEPVNSCEGRGAYLLRDEANAIPVALMAPHRGADRWTGNIAAQLFDEHPFAAAAWNSAPRRSTGECKASGDVTRVKNHFFTSFSLAFASRFPHGRVVQLHGFEHRLRTSKSGSQADVILSNGSETPDDGLLGLAECLVNALPLHRISVFPFDTQELGALQNKQGQALRSAGFGGFVHIEISRELRKALTQDVALRASLAKCLAAGTK